jgi:hypothetical protein
LITDLEPPKAKIEAAEKAIQPLQLRSAHLALREVTLVSIAS